MLESIRGIAEQMKFPQVSVQVSSVNDVYLTLLPASTYDWWLGKKQIRLQLRLKQCYHYHGKIEAMRIKPLAIFIVVFRRMPEGSCSIGFAAAAQTPAS